MSEWAERGGPAADRGKMENKGSGWGCVSEWEREAGGSMYVCRAGTEGNKDIWRNT